MSRDFKQEYTSLIKEQTPDLWDRIEANLVAKEPASVGAGVQSSLTVVQGKQTSERPLSSKWKANAGRYVSYGMAAAAAILICLVVVPFVGMVIFPKGAMESADGARYMVAMDTAENDAVSAEEWAEYEVCEEAADMGADQTTAFSMYEEAEENGMASGSTKNDSFAETDKYEAVTESAKEAPAEKEAEVCTDDTSATAGTGTEAKRTYQVEIQSVQKQGDLTVYQAMFGAETISFILAETIAGSEEELAAGMTYQVVLENAEAGLGYEYIVVDIK